MENDELYKCFYIIYENYKVDVLLMRLEQINLLNAKNV